MDQIKTKNNKIFEKRFLNQKHIKQKNYCLKTDPIHFFLQRINSG